MEKQQLNRQDVAHCLYYGGYISCLIKRLLEAYEAYDYKLANLRKIGKDSYAISSLPRDNKVWRRSIEIKKLNDEDLITLGFDPKKIYYEDTVFLPSSDMLEKYNAITFGIDIKTLKKYPYIQEFIDFLNEKHKLTSNEEEFIKCMKDYLGEFIASNKYEINHYIQSHYYNKEKPCMVNRATFFNALKYMLEKYEKSVECYDNVQAIREDKGEYEEIELFQSFVIFSPKGQFELNSYVGKVIGKDINVKESYNNSEMDIDFFINNLVLQSTKMLENFVVLKYFAYRMYELTKEKEKIETSDVELILADIINEYKRVRGRNSN